MPLLIDYLLDRLTDYAQTFYSYSIGSNTIQNAELIMLSWAAGFRAVAYVVMRLYV